MNDRFLIDTLSGVFDEDAEFIPLMSQEDEDKINKEETPEILPILSLKYGFISWSSYSNYSG